MQHAAGRLRAKHQRAAAMGDRIPAVYEALRARVLLHQLAATTTMDTQVTL